MDEYPRWRYHATEKPKLVNDPVEDEALGDGWADTPAAFEAKPEPEPKPEPKPKKAKPAKETE